MFSLGSMVAISNIGESRLLGDNLIAENILAPLITSPVICAGRITGVSSISAREFAEYDCFTFQVDSFIKGTSNSNRVIYIIFPESLSTPPDQAGVDKMKSKRWMLFLAPVSVENGIYKFVNMEPESDGSQILPISSEPINHDISASWSDKLEDEVLAAINCSDPEIVMPSLAFLQSWGRSNEKILLALKEISTNGIDNIKARALAVYMNILNEDGKHPLHEP